MIIEHAACIREGGCAHGQHEPIQSTPWPPDPKCANCRRHGHRLGSTSEACPRDGFPLPENLCGWSPRRPVQRKAEYFAVPLSVGAPLARWSKPDAAEAVTAALSAARRQGWGPWALVMVDEDADGPAWTLILRCDAMPAPAPKAKPAPARKPAARPPARLLRSLRDIAAQLDARAAEWTREAEAKPPCRGRYVREGGAMVCATIAREIRACLEV